MRIFFGTILVIGALSGLVLQGSFLNFILVFAAALYLLVPFAIVLLAIRLVQLLRKIKPGPRFKRAFFVWCSVASCLLVSSITGTTVHWREITAVQNYVAKAAPVLDEIKVREGTYPVTLPVSLLGQPPSLLSEPSSYSSDGKEFRFEYWDPAGMMDGYEFNSTDRTWKYFD